MSIFSQKVEVEAGQVLADARYEVGEIGRLYKVLYADNNIVVLRGDAGKHRLELREQFNKSREHGRFKVADKDVTFEDAEINWAIVDGVGETTTDRLHDAGFVTAIDVQKATLNELREVSGIGEKNARNLARYAKSSQ